MLEWDKDLIKQAYERVQHRRHFIGPPKPKPVTPSFDALCTICWHDIDMSKQVGHCVCCDDMFHTTCMHMLFTSGCVIDFCSRCYDDFRAMPEWQRDLFVQQHADGLSD